MEGTMKRLMLMGKGGPWEMQEVPIPKPGYGEFLAKYLQRPYAIRQTIPNLRWRA